MNAPIATQNEGIRDCTECAVGRAADVAHGGRCPLSHRARPAGTFLYVQGQTADRVWFVKRGALILSREVAGDGSKESVTWAVRRSGDFVGVEALTQKRYADSAKLLRESVLCGSDLRNFETWLHGSGGSAESVLRCVISTHARDVPRRAGSDGNAIQRAAAWVLEEGGQPNATTLPRHHVAQMLGMLPETFSRALASLASRGAIELTRRSVSIRNLELLESVANHDDAC